MKTFTITDRAHKGIKIAYSAQMTRYIAVGQAIHKEMENVVPEGTLFLTHFLDIAGDRLVKEANPRDRRALVSVETHAGEGGGVKLFANTVGERWDEKRRRVVREANPFEKAVGVSLVATEETEAGPYFLLTMEPGSSFRITRTGELEGAAPELVVLWNGRWDERRVNHPDTRGDVRYWGLSLFERQLRHGEV